MTPKQFNAALLELGLTQVAAARMLGLTDRAIRLYAAGDRAIHPCAAKLIRLALDGIASIDEIEAR